MVIASFCTFFILLKNALLSKEGNLRVHIEELISNCTLILFGIYVNVGTHSSLTACVEKPYDLYLLASNCINSYLLASQLY